MRKPFQFKKFEIYQEKVSLPVNTDSVLFGAITEFSNPKTIVDLGTGTGLLMLMMHQKYPQTTVTGYEKDPDSIECAKQNLRFNSAPYRLSVEPFDWWKDELLTATDSIICNPPFFSNQLISSSEQKIASRHLTEKDLLFLIKRVSHWLKIGGEASWLLPFDQYRISQYEEALKSVGCTISRATSIQANPNKKPHLLQLFVEKSMETAAIEMKELCVYERSGGLFTEETRELLLPFLLNRAIRQ